MLTAFFVPGLFELIIIACILGFPLLVIGTVLSTQRRTGVDHSENPNLRPCSDCGHPISVRAHTCPQCGGPVKGT
jgi:hypothetical protein